MDEREEKTTEAATRVFSRYGVKRADLIEKSWGGFKYEAKTKKHLRELLASLQALVLAVAERA